MRIIPFNNSLKNKYDSIFKISSHCFVDALIQIVDIPEDDYELLSCEIFSPGKDVKSMDILLKGETGYVNIEFHKQPLSKSTLDRNFEYVVHYYLFYGETIDQKIVVIDNNRKSIEKIQITPNLEFKGNYYYVSDIDGQEVLNNIKDKVKTNTKLNDYEQYIFSIFPLTKHDYDNDDELMEELCNLTSHLNIPEKNREAICLIQVILLDLFVHNKELKDKLYKVITMTSTFIENHENSLIHRIEIAEKMASDAENNRRIAEKMASDAEKNKRIAEKNKMIAEKERNEAEKLIKEIVGDSDNAKNFNLSKSSMYKLLNILAKF